MELRIEMPAVMECDASECAYNSEPRCQAKAITIGDGVQADCETFLGRANRNETAGVGACMVTGCRHNHDLECAAAPIHVGIVEQLVNCMTYESRAMP